jgi:prepilin-type N-terminal cleavage/methylation domain-containing protein
MSIFIKNSTYVASNKKAFTLIELLVVVAIIGILAAVGVVAYNGYTGAAKIQTVKSNHKNVVKYVNSELMKCLIGGELQPIILKQSNSSQYAKVVSNFSCQNVNSGNQYKTEHLFANLITYLENYKNSKNVFESSRNYFKSYNQIPKEKGFTYCAWDDPGDGGQGYCRTRFGDGSNDYIETIFIRISDYE